MEIITKTTTQPAMVAIFPRLFSTLSISPELSSGLMIHIWKVQEQNEKVVALEEITCPCLL